MILLIKHKVGWELIRQQKLKRINKYDICKNNNKFDHNYKVVDKFMVDNNAAYKYETSYKGPFVIMHFWTNGEVTLRWT